MIGARQFTLAVNVVSKLLSKEAANDYVKTLKQEYITVAEKHRKGEADKKRTSLAAARENGFIADFSNYTPKKPSFLGTKTYQNWDLAELARYIDWTPFFQAWEFKGVYPKILEDERQGEAASQLFEDAKAMLARIIDEKWFTPKAVVGFWPANRKGDDVAVYADDERGTELASFYTLRQQLSKSGDKPNVALADFMAEPGTPDYIGGFCVTAGFEEIEIADRFDAELDNYSSILVKALADRFAEAFAERLHELVRTELWGYAPDEAFAPEELIAESYAGIRPAPGYPAQPDHTEKTTLFKLLDAEKEIGVKLTESFAMWPGSSVSGLYFAHPQSYYFGVAKVEQDQVEDYARRKGMAVTEIERWLGPVLNYIPGSEKAAS